jgi:hypothetical protein
VYATTKKECGTVYKKKFEEDNEGCLRERFDKVAEIPNRCGLCNQDIRNAPIPSDIDYEWYVEFANKKIKEMKEIALYDNAR